MQTKTNANLDMFTDNILVQIKHLEVTLDTIKQTLNKINVASARSVAYILENTQGRVRKKLKHGIL